MALTITQQPQDITPAYNDQFFVAISDQIAQPGFKYIVDVVINGATYTEDILQRPDGYMVFNAMEKAKNHIERVFDPRILQPQNATNKTVEIEVTITEYYSSATHDTEVVTYQAWDACLTEKDFQDYYFADYTINGADTYLLDKNHQTDQFIYPDNRITLTTDVWLHFYRNGSDQITLKLYDETNTLLNTYLFAFPITVEPMVYFNIGPKILQNVGATVLPGYRVTCSIDVTSGPSVLLTTEYTVTEIDTDYDLYTLYYLNRNGNINHFHFEKLSEKSESIKTSAVKLAKNKLDTTTGAYGSNIWDRENHIVSTELSNKITLNSDWITESQSTMLKEAFSSPIRWLKDPSGDYLPMTITDTTYSEKRNASDPLFNWTVSADFSTIETRQRGI